LLRFSARPRRAKAQQQNKFYVRLLMTTYLHLKFYNTPLLRFSARPRRAKAQQQNKFYVRLLMTTHLHLKSYKHKI